MTRRKTRKTATRLEDLRASAAVAERELDEAETEMFNAGAGHVMAKWDDNLELLERLKDWAESSPRPPFPWALQVRLEEELRDQKEARREFIFAERRARR